MSEQRFAERRRGRRRPTQQGGAAGVLAVAAAAGLVWLVWFSSVLGVHRVEVTGLTTLEAAEVREVAAIEPRRPLARVDTVAAEVEVSGIQRVEQVEVSRSWPRTITIAVVERTAVAWVRVDGEPQALDRYGVEFRTLSKVPDGLVEVRVPATDARSRQRALEAAAAVVAGIRTDDPGLAEAIRHVEATTQDSVVLALTRGRTVTWGSPAKPKEKLEVLRALLPLKARGYDVSAPEQPTTRQE